MPYYGKGTELEVLTDLHTQLSAVTGVKFVDFQRIASSGIDPTRYPGCFINSVRTDKQRLLKDIVRNVFAVAIVGWEWADQNENLITVLNTFIDAVKVKVMTDTTRGSKALSTEIRSITTDGGSRHPQAQFVIILDIIYFSSE
jgi:hypothetical protein